MSRYLFNTVFITVVGTAWTGCFVLHVCISAGKTSIPWGKIYFSGYFYVIDVQRRGYGDSHLSSWSSWIGLTLIVLFLFGHGCIFGTLSDEAVYGTDQQRLLEAAK